MVGKLLNVDVRKKGTLNRIYNYKEIKNSLSTRKSNEESLENHVLLRCVSMIYNDRFCENATVTHEEQVAEQVKYCFVHIKTTFLLP